jgi:hypothetical protein
LILIKYLLTIPEFRDCGSEERLYYVISQLPHVHDKFFFKSAVIFSVVPAAEMRQFVRKSAKNGGSGKWLSRIV